MIAVHISSRDVHGEENRADAALFEPRNIGLRLRGCTDIGAVDSETRNIVVGVDQDGRFCNRRNLLIELLVICGKDCATQQQH